MSPEFHLLRVSFGRMFSRVRSAVMRCNPPIDELKLFLEDLDSQLEQQLADTNSLQGILRLIRENCSLIDVHILEAVVEHFEIADVGKYIEEYKTTLDEFCRTISVSLCLRESFDVVKTHPPLRCKTATYVFDWEPDEHTLKDIRDILAKSSGKLVKIKYIDTGRSIIVTCTFPHFLMGAVVIKVVENLELLIRNSLIIKAVALICRVDPRFKMAAHCNLLRHPVL